MEPNHPYLLRLFDYFAALCFGVVAAIVTGYVIPASWPMIIAMPLAMILGMITTFPLLGLFTALVGGFEILMMSMQIGMLAGMVGVMSPNDTIFGLLTIGAATGFFIQFFLHIMDRRLHGEVMIGRSSDE